MIAEIWITDPKGRAYLNAPLEGIDFTFNPDPKVQAQASAFWPLLDGQTSVINQPMMRREIDNKHFKYVGVPGVDKPRIVQVGTPGQSLQALRDDVGVQKLVRVLVASGALKAIHVVQKDMAELASEVAGSDNRATLDNKQKEVLRDVIATGKSRTEIKAKHIEVFQSIRDEFDTSIGAFVVQLPRQGLDDLLTEQALAALAIGIVIFLIGGMVSLSFADRIAKPIGTVTQVAGQVGQGDFGRLEQLERTSERTDEIGELARVFKTMANDWPTRTWPCPMRRRSSPRNWIWHGACNWPSCPNIFRRPSAAAAMPACCPPPKWAAIFTTSSPCPTVGSPWSWPTSPARV